MSKSNKYQTDRRKKSVLGGLPAMPHKNGNASLKTTGLNTLYDILGVIIGGGIGAAFGRPSLLIGAVVTGVGHYCDKKYISSLGVGIMAANGFQGNTGLSVHGLDEEEEIDTLDGIKERLTNFKNTFSEKLFIDKFLKKLPAATPKAVHGLGDARQYFSYPDQVSGVGELGAGEIDMSALEDIQKQIEQSARDFSQQQKKPLSGLGESSSGDNDELDYTAANY